MCKMQTCNVFIQHYLLKQILITPSWCFVSKKHQEYLTVPLFYIHFHIQILIENFKQSPPDIHVTITAILLDLQHPDAFLQESFFVFSQSTSCADRKSMRSLAAFRGRSNTTEWPQLSNSATWQFGSAASSTAAPETSTTWEEDGSLQARCFFGGILATPLGDQQTMLRICSLLFFFIAAAVLITSSVFPYLHFKTFRWIITFLVHITTFCIMYFLTFRRFFFLSYYSVITFAFWSPCIYLFVCVFLA